jgi:hypothetical protein
MLNSVCIRHCMHKTLLWVLNSLLLYMNCHSAMLISEIKSEKEKIICTSSILPSLQNATPSSTPPAPPTHRWCRNHRRWRSMPNRSHQMLLQQLTSNNICRPCAVACRSHASASHTATFLAPPPQLIDYRGVAARPRSRVTTQGSLSIWEHGRLASDARCTVA